MHIYILIYYIYSLYLGYTREECALHPFNRAIHMRVYVFFMIQRIHHTLVCMRVLENACICVYGSAYTYIQGRLQTSSLVGAKN